ncbi:MAG: chemotaxis protein CheW [Planctomycetota bacterium]
MVEAILEREEEYYATESKNGRYLSFTFFEKNHGMELEVLGWTELTSRPDAPDYVRGVVNPWGCEIPVIDLRILYGKGAAVPTDAMCIIIFEHTQSYEYYFAIVVEELSNVINIVDGTENRTSPLLLSARRHLSVSPAIKHREYCISAPDESAKAAERSVNLLS